MAYGTLRKEELLDVLEALALPSAPQVRQLSINFCELTDEMLRYALKAMEQGGKRTEELEVLNLGNNEDYYSHVAMDRIIDAVKLQGTGPFPSIRELVMDQSSVRKRNKEMEAKAAGIPGFKLILT